MDHVEAIEKVVDKSEPVRLFIQHWALTISFVLLMVNAVKLAQDSMAAMVQILMFLLAGSHVSNACTAMIEIYRVGMKKSGKPTKFQS